MLHVVVATESGKLLAGHEGKLTEPQAVTRADRANQDAEKLGITTRYEAKKVTASEMRELKH